MFVVMRSSISWPSSLWFTEGPQLDSAVGACTEHVPLGLEAEWSHCVVMRLFYVTQLSQHYWVVLLRLQGLLAVWRRHRLQGAWAHLQVQDVGQVRRVAGEDSRWPCYGPRLRDLWWHDCLHCQPGIWHAADFGNFLACFCLNFVLKSLLLFKWFRRAFAHRIKHLGFWFYFCLRCFVKLNHRRHWYLFLDLSMLQRWWFSVKIVQDHVWIKFIISILFFSKIFIATIVWLDQLSSSSWVENRLYIASHTEWRIILIASFMHFIFVFKLN